MNKPLSLFNTSALAGTNLGPSQRDHYTTISRLGLFGASHAMDIGITPGKGSRFIQNMAAVGSPFARGPVARIAEASKKFNVPNLDALIVQASQKYGVDANLIRAVIIQESGGNPKAISPAGAQGIMQFMPATARGWGLNNKTVFDAALCIDAGVHYLHNLLEEFNGDTRLALAAYNAGAKAVKKYNGVPPYTETQNYVRSIMGMIQ